jgi:type IX secretion system PorP/SprF family membrane protein
MAQNMVLSQPYVNAQFLSPALVGDGQYDQRIQSNLRSQMFGAINVSSTIVAGWDSRFKSKDVENNSSFGYGFQIMSDQLAGGLLQTNYLTMNLAYRIFVDEGKNNSIALGLAGTYAQSTLNQSKLRLGDQLNSQMNNLTASTGLPASELFFNKFPASITANTGFVFTNHSENKFIQLGLGAFFNTIPNIVSNVKQEASGMRTSLFLNSEIVVGEDKTFVAHAYYSNRSNNASINQQILAGGAISLPIAYKFDKVRRLYLGCYYRLNEAILPTFSIMMDTYIFGLSYDVYNNGSSGASIKQNSFELSLSTSFGKKRNEFLRTIFD